VAQFKGGRVTLHLGRTRHFLGSAEEALGRVERDARNLTWRGLNDPRTGTGEDLRRSG
jgi:hypothetical protein